MAAWPFGRLLRFSRVSTVYIYKALIRRRLTVGTRANPVRGRPPRKLSPEQEQALEAHIRSRPGSMPKAQWTNVSTTARHSFGHWKKMTLRAGLRLTGMTAPRVLDGPMDGTAFCAYIRHILEPTLKRDDVAMLDNLPAHKVADVREVVAHRRMQIFYLRPCRPDMKSIEMAFSKLKALLRHELPRSIDSFVQRIGLPLDRFVPTKCANFFHTAGYQRSR